MTAWRSNPYVMPIKALLPTLLASLLLAACHGPGGSSNGTAQDTTAGAAAGNTPVTHTETSPANAANGMRAGHNVGSVFLGEDSDSLLQALGKPDFSDAAMGKAWLTWLGKKDEHNNQTQLDVFVTYKDSTMSTRTVQQIRTTSSAYQLADSLHVYSSFQRLQGAYPELVYTGNYKDEGREIKIYDAAAAGVAFEIVEAGSQRICTGIIIHPRGKAVNNVYFSHSAGHRP